MANYYAVVNPTFQPAMRNILSITQAEEALITTTFDGIIPGDHDYLTGLIVRLIVPDGFGMVQANELYGPITVTSSSTFTIPINTTSFDPYVVPAYNPGHFGTPGQVVPIGEINELLNQSTENVLPYP